MLKKIHILIVIMALFSQSPLFSQTRRALLVGINIYQPEEKESGDRQKIREQPGRENSRGNWFNLDGAVNDMEAMKAILVSRFGFEHDNIRILKNSQATRDRIISDFRSHLIAKSRPGDIALFYYAGHGSQVKNSLSREADKLDESLVPADSYRGARDIRDKELWKLYNDVQDRGARLTVIIDSCHSGSISRGLSGPTTYRYLAPDSGDANDPAWYEQTPAEKGALIFSATQDFEPAAEFKDDDDINHGLFTWALLKTLREGPLDEPPMTILLKVKALIRAQGKTQEPNIEATPERKKMGLLGAEAAGLNGQITLAVQKILKAQKKIEFQGGLATGIRKGCELKQLLPEKDRRTPPRILITEVTDLNRSVGEILQGELDHIQSGDMFVVDKWVVSEGLEMGVMVPRSGLSRSRILSECRKIFQIVRKNGASWVNDPVEQTPSHILFWQGDGWKLKLPDNGIIHMGLAADTGLIEKALRSHGSGSLFFLNVPLEEEIYASLVARFQDSRSLVKINQSYAGSHYILTGRFVREQIEYALVIPNVSRESSQYLPLPTRTDWIAAEGDDRTGGHLIAELKKYALRIMKIKAWLGLSSPPNQASFPYHLALRNAQTGEIKTGGEVFEEEIYGLILRTDDTRIGPEFDFHYVYVFSIDKFGRSTLLYPNRILGTIENKLPARFTDDNRLPGKIQLGNERLFRIDDDAFGEMTFFLLASRNPIPDPGVLQVDGVRTRGMPSRNGTRESANPLQKLLNFMSSPKRGIEVISPGDWSLERLSIVSRPRNKLNQR